MHACFSPCQFTRPLSCTQGIGISGILQAGDTKISWLPAFYANLRQYDRDYSARHGFPTSIKLTTVKPSGTLSLLAGVTPGIHPAYSEYMIRRIRINANNPLVDICSKNGYPMESNLRFDGTPDHTTKVVSFPCRFPPQTVFAGDVSALDQLDLVKRFQSIYSDNAVSCTVYYRLSELDSIRDWLARNYSEHLKGRLPSLIASLCANTVSIFSAVLFTFALMPHTGCSFLLHSDHGFKQAPLEAISRDQYLALAHSVRPITDGCFLPDDNALDTSLECETGHCPVK